MPGQGALCILPICRKVCWVQTLLWVAPPLAIGAALTAKTLKTGERWGLFTGDGGSNQGLVFEAINMAVVLQLPCHLYFREQRLWRRNGP